MRNRVSGDLSGQKTNQQSSHDTKAHPQVSKAEEKPQAEVKEKPKAPDQSVNKVAKWRHDLGEFLEGRKCQSLLANLLRIDIICIIVELLISADIIHASHYTGHALHLFSFSILCFFALDVSLLIVSFGISFFKQPIYILDFFVIFLSIILEMKVSHDEAELLIILLLWRVIRILHGVYTYREIKHKEKESLHKTH